jgi:hypothetical protein
MSRGRTAAINLAVFLLMLACAEIAVRVYLRVTRGDSTASIAERNLYLSYQPFVMFGPAWDARLTPPRPPADPAHPPYRILVLGASVADGFPPQTIVEAFSRQLPGREVQVIMASSGGYVARQELVVAAIWGPTVKPDLIVTFDGGNDLDVRLRIDKPGTFALSPTYDLMLKRPLLAPFAYLLAQSQAYNGIKRLTARYTVGPVDSYADAIPVYVAAQHGITTIAKGTAAQRLMVLEPFVGFKTPLSDAEAGMTAFRYREPVMKALYDRTHAQLTGLAAADHVAYLDARFLFAGVRDTIFRDDVHFVGDRAYRMLAEAMAGCLRDGRMDEHSCAVSGRQP